MDVVIRREIREIQQEEAMRRIPELDALRGLAAVAIVFYHLWFTSYGFMGTAVDLFFVMSGYLITTIILKQREQPGFLATFYARRSLRIWPIYYLSILAYVVLSPVLPKSYHAEGLPYFLTYTQNLWQYWGAANPPFAEAFNHTWSLAVEEQYYLFWPLCLVFLGKRSVVPLAVGLMALAVGARMAGFSIWLLLTRLDGLALGGVLAAMLNSDDSARLPAETIKRSLIAAGLVSVAWLAKGNVLMAALATTWPALGKPLVALSLRMFATNLMYFSMIGLVVVNSGHRRLSWLRDSRLAWLGQMSYGIYLYHHMLFEIVQGYADRYGVTNRVAIDAVKLTSTFALSALSWHLIEQPVLSLKDRFGYLKRSAIPAPKSVAELARRESLRSGAR
jgi:peptidoglycan/LPS O-acetylase OafA/YrhL